MRELSVFKCLNQEQIKKAGIKLSDEFFCFRHSKDQTTQIEYERHNDDYLLQRKNAAEAWSDEQYGLVFQSKIIINNPDALFGSEGAIVTGGQFSVLALWQNKSVAGVVVGKPTDTGEYLFEFDFPPSKTRGEITITFKIVLSGIPEFIKDDEKHFASQPGSIVGIIRQIRIVSETFNSFPVEIIDGLRNDGMLWRLKQSWESPSDDFYGESSSIPIRLLIDKSFYKESCNIYNKKVLAEVFASANTMIIQRALAKGVTDEIGDDSSDYYGKGNIGDYIWYWMNQSGVNWEDSIETMTEKLQKCYLDLFGV